MKPIIYPIILSFALLCSCGLSDIEDEYQFDRSLRGTWETTDTRDTLGTKIEILARDIIITGDIAHFKDFIEGIGIKGYSRIEDGDSLLYLYDINDIERTIAYGIRESGVAKKTKILILKSNSPGLKDETFKFREMDY
jgi:hypothetical protein